MLANLSVNPCAMDADCTYAELHRQFDTECSHSHRQDSEFPNSTRICSHLVISHPLHILTRARYRLLGSAVHLGKAGEKAGPREKAGPVTIHIQLSVINLSITIAGTPLSLSQFNNLRSIVSIT